MASGKHPVSNNSVRTAWIAMLAAALPILVADDLFGSYVRVYWRHGLAGGLFSYLPSPLGALPAWLIVGLGLVSVALAALGVWRLIWGARPLGKARRTLWFDLRHDPLQTRPWGPLSLEFGLKACARALARRYRDVYGELHARVVPEGPRALDVDPATLKQLRALGYID